MPHRKCNVLFVKMARQLKAILQSHLKKMVPLLCLNTFLQYRKAYNKISLEDYLIASCATINSLYLWTNNKKHYPMNEIHLKATVAMASFNFYQWLTYISIACFTNSFKLTPCS